MPQLTSTRVAGYRRFPKGRNNAQLFAQSRTLRIRQTVGLDLSIARSTSPLQPVAILLLSYFHKVSRAAGPTTTNRQLRSDADPDDVGKRGVVRNLLIEAQSGEPSPRQMHA